MKILVTGGAGFMGSDFIRFLLQYKLAEKVVNYDLLTYAGNLKNLEAISNDKRYIFVCGDIADEKLLKETIQSHQIDTIVNFAAETHVDRSINDPMVFLRTNVLGTATLLNVATELKLRLHHVSTDEVFGSLKLNEKRKFVETTRYDPKSPYSASKAASDHLVKAYFNTYKTNVTLSNSSNNYGPYQYPEKFIPVIITNLLKGKKIPLYGDGLYTRDWLFVRDHSKGIWAILQKGKKGESYCLGGGNETRNIELCKTILKALGKKENWIEHVEDRKGHDRRYSIDYSKARKFLGWKPEVPLNEGLTQTINWYKNNIKWWNTPPPRLAKTRKKTEVNYAFIDSQNLNLGIQSQGWELDFKRFRVYLNDKFGITKAFLFIGYLDKFKPMYEQLKSYGYVLIFKPTLVHNDGTAKGNVDSELVLYASKIEYDNYDKAIIVSGDGDFYCLIEYLAKHKKLKQVFIPNRRSYSRLLTKFKKYFFTLNNLKPKLSKQ